MIPIPQMRKLRLGGLPSHGARKWCSWNSTGGRRGTRGSDQGGEGRLRMPWARGNMGRALNSAWSGRETLFFLGGGMTAGWTRVSHGEKWGCGVTATGLRQGAEGERCWVTRSAKAREQRRSSATHTLPLPVSSFSFSTGRRSSSSRGGFRRRKRVIHVCGRVPPLSRKISESAKECSRRPEKVSP